MAADNSGAKFFKTVFAGEVDFDAEKFLLEVNSQFKSEQIRSEVQWRLDVLGDISAREELGDVSAGLRSELSRVFSSFSGEAEILAELKRITEIRREDGEVIDLRRFITRVRRTLSADEYRVFLRRKVQNTNFQIENLTMFYPEANQVLDDLRDLTDSLYDRVDNPASTIRELRNMEGDIRELPAFQRYETLKGRFLQDWLAKFTKLSEAEAAKLSPEEIQKLIVETQRHQLTQLIKSEIVIGKLDMSQYLGAHDTLEGEFRNEEFWTRAHKGVRSGFKNWVLGVIQAFGMTKGRRHVLFQRKAHEDQMLLFGLGLALPEAAQAPEGEEEQALPRKPTQTDLGRLSLVPYVKPFTRKTGYLFEIRRRDLSDAEEYHQQLRHALMPFLFAFEGMKEFKLSSDLMSFFTSTY